LGLTGGIVDVGGLSDCLEGIYSGQAGDSILDVYDTVRRAKYNEVVNPVSTGNIRLLFEQNPETALDENEFLKTCKKAEMDPEVGAAQRKAANVLQYDFRRHYQKREFP
jgi:hypothetical protein